jgi:translation initiation factor 5B
MSGIQAEMAAQRLNAVLSTRNANVLEYVSLVPTSTITGEGIQDLIMLLVQLTQSHMSPKLKYSDDSLEGTVLEVKVEEGRDTTLDVILVNGVLREARR